MIRISRFPPAYSITIESPAGGLSLSSKTKIVVLRMKELIYTGIFVALGILLILLLVYMFAPKGKKSPAIADAHTPPASTPRPSPWAATP